MKLFVVLVVVLASASSEEIVDTETTLTLDLDPASSDDVPRLKAGTENSQPWNSNYVAPSQRPPRPWGYNPQQNFQQPQNTYNPSGFNNLPSTNLPSTSNYAPQNIIPQNNYNNYVPQNTWTPPNTGYKPANNINNAYYPANNIGSGSPINNLGNQNDPPQSWTPPKENKGSQNNYQNQWNQNQNQNQWNQNQNQWTKPQIPETTTTTTQATVIKNEQFFGENGNYKYEYQIGDGTSVGEEGYIVNPNSNKESIVKKGWYSYPGADGKIYTVTYWADETGFHAFGEHLPTPPPVPAAIQASLDITAKEEAEKNKQQQGQQSQPVAPQQPPAQHPLSPQSALLPQQPLPPQQTYYPQTQPQATQQTYYPPQNSYSPNYGK